MADVTAASSNERKNRMAMILPPGMDAKTPGRVMNTPRFVSENEEVKAIVGEITKHTKRRGIFVYDRGGDNIEFYRCFLEKGLDFIVRLKERHVRSWKRNVMCGE